MTWAWLFNIFDSSSFVGFFSSGTCRLLRAMNIDCEQAKVNLIYMFAYMHVPCLGFSAIQNVMPSALPEFELLSQCQIWLSFQSMLRMLSRGAAFFD